MKNVSKTCRNCLKETKVVVVDLNLYNRRGKIKFKRCKMNSDFCLTLILDKISINMNKI